MLFFSMVSREIYYLIVNFNFEVIDYSSSSLTKVLKIVSFGNLLAAAAALSFLIVDVLHFKIHLKPWVKGLSLALVIISNTNLLNVWKINRLLTDFFRVQLDDMFLSKIVTILLLSMATCAFHFIALKLRNGRA